MSYEVEKDKKQRGIARNWGEATRLRWEKVMEEQEGLSGFLVGGKVGGVGEGEGERRLGNLAAEKRWGNGWAGRELASEGTKKTQAFPRFHISKKRTSRRRVGEGCQTGCEVPAP